MKPVFRRHRRLFAAGILLAFLAVWVLPAQACIAAGTSAATQCECPGCPDTVQCSTTVACAGSVVSAVTTPVPSLGKTLPAPAILVSRFASMTPPQARFVPDGRLPAYPLPTSLNVRFCSFQE